MSHKHQDPRRNLPKDHFAHQPLDIDELRELLPRTKPVDVFLVISLIAAWILVGAFLVVQYSKSKKSIVISPNDKPQSVPTSRYKLPDWATNNEPVEKFEEYVPKEEIEIVDPKLIPVKGEKPSKVVLPPPTTNPAGLITAPPPPPTESYSERFTELNKVEAAPAKEEGEEFEDIEELESEKQHNPPPHPMGREVK
jgi:hypothetical protein